MTTTYLHYLWYTPVTGSEIGQLQSKSVPDGLGFALAQSDAKRTFCEF
jgi:hypothetical protein